MAGPDGPKNGNSQDGPLHNVIEFPSSPRRSTQECIEAGLTGIETAVLSATGAIKPAGSDTALEFHEPDLRIDVELTTILALEREAVIHAKESLADYSSLPRVTPPELLYASATTNELRTKALTSIADAIIMGELSGKLAAVQEEHRDEVLAIILSELADLSEEMDLFLVIVQCLGQSMLLDALDHSDEELRQIQDFTNEDFENLEPILARLILKARENIAKKSTSEERYREGKRGLKPIRLIK